jgi:GH15 family glucan-1,4-alpha-glucosidase
VGDDGSLDWLCLPRFDSAACFAALLGDERHGRWLLAPASAVVRVSRRYRPGTLVHETEFETTQSVVRIIDCMPPRGSLPDVVRLVCGVRGRVPMRTELTVRLDYGSVVLWLRSDVELDGERLSTVGEFSIGEGEEAGFVLTWAPSHEDAPRQAEPRALVRDTTSWWERRAGGSSGLSAAPTTAITATRCSGRWSCSTRSRSRRPAVSSPLRQRRCPSSSAACATGTTATAGCVTRRSR